MSCQPSAEFLWGFGRPCVCRDPPMYFGSRTRGHDRGCGRGEFLAFDDAWLGRRSWYSSIKDGGHLQKCLPSDTFVIDAEKLFVSDDAKKNRTACGGGYYCAGRSRRHF